jgi:DNA-binding PadR family transcriptional regulator
VGLSDEARSLEQTSRQVTDDLKHDASHARFDENLRSLKEQSSIETRTVTHLRDGTVADVVSVTPGGQSALYHHRDPDLDSGPAPVPRPLYAEMGERGGPGIMWCSRSWFGLAPIIAIPWARGGRVKVAAPDGRRGASTRERNFIRAT